MAASVQQEIWNGDVGATWVEHADHFDATLEPFGEAVIERLGPGPGDRVVDVGCGTGATTLRLAALVSPATVTGLDVSRPMLTAAEERAAAAGVTNVVFSEADVEVAAFAVDAFDVVFSRFGVMFFAEPERAFQHIRESLVDGGRLGFVYFQAPSENPFIVVPIGAAAAHLQMPPPAGAAAPGPFGLADRERTAAMLTAAGFDQVEIEPGPTQAVLSGADDLTALARRLLEQNPSLAHALAAATSAARDAAVSAAAAALAPHRVAGRVTLGTWVVTATARGR